MSRGVKPFSKRISTIERLDIYFDPKTFDFLLSNFKVSKKSVNFWDDIKKSTS